MDSVYGEVPCWTLVGLFIAFVDLFVAYILLCVSAWVFFPYKFLSFIGLYLPCPCSGLLGYQNSEFCWHRLMIDRPIRNISYVTELVKSRFPFGLICSRDRHLDVEVSSVGDGRHGASYCSPVCRGSGYDAKGKRIVNLKSKYAIRRRRRALLGDGKYSNGLNSCGSNSVGVLDALCSGIGSSLDCHILTDYGIPDTRIAVNGIEASSSIHQYLEEGGSEEREKATKLRSSTDKFEGDDQEMLGSAQDKTNRCRMLEKALEEEKAARFALYLELEKERAAAATAADEAMAMILRLQEDKASIEMEAKQYQRMIEEKFAYDEEEMDVLKEILVRRERENHFLEKELETYREMNVSSSEGLDEDDFGDKKHPSGLNPSLLNMPKSKTEQETATSTDHLTDHGKRTSHAYRENLLKQELPTVLTVSHGLQQRTVNSVMNSSLRDVSLKSLGLVETEACDSNGKEPENGGEECKLKNNDDFSNQINPESTVLDIHVIDDKSIIWKENDRGKSGQLGRPGSDSGICGCKVLRDCPSKCSSEVASSGAVSNDLQTKSMNSVAGEWLKTDSEVE